MKRYILYTSIHSSTNPGSRGTGCQKLLHAVTVTDNTNTANCIRGGDGVKRGGGGVKRGEVG